MGKAGTVPGGRAGLLKDPCVGGAQRLVEEILARGGRVPSASQRSRILLKGS